MTENKMTHGPAWGGFCARCDEKTILRNTEIANMNITQYLQICSFRKEIYTNVYLEKQEKKSR